MRGWFNEHQTLLSSKWKCLNQMDRPIGHLNADDWLNKNWKHSFFIWKFWSCRVTFGHYIHTHVKVRMKEHISYIYSLYVSFGSKLFAVFRCCLRGHIFRSSLLCAAVRRGSCCCYTAAVTLLLLDPRKEAMAIRRRLLLHEFAGVFCCGTLGRELSRSADSAGRILEWRHRLAWETTRAELWGRDTPPLSNTHTSSLCWDERGGRCASQKELSDRGRGTCAALVGKPLLGDSVEGGNQTKTALHS